MEVNIFGTLSLKENISLRIIKYTIYLLQAYQSEENFHVYKYFIF